jgi:hypothetical protein
MAFYRGNLFWKMLANSFFSQTRPVGKLTSFDCLDPSVRDWAESCGVKESYQVFLADTLIKTVCFTKLY